MTSHHLREAVERPTALPRERRAPAYVSDLAADVLRDLGVRYVPINPGSSFRGLHDSVVNHSGNADPQLILCIHEEIAVSMAHAYAKATGTVGVAAVHDLVGLMHASMAVYNAWCDQAPLLLLGGGGPVDAASRRGIDWLHSASTQASLVRDYVKWDDEPLSAGSLVDSLVRGHALAGSAPRGPVYVTLDMELQEKELDAPVALPEVARRPGAHAIAAPADAVDHAADLLLAASSPAVVAGNLAFDRAATGPLVALVESTGAAYRDDHNAVSFPTAHPQNLSGDAELLTGERADLVVLVDVNDPASVLRQCAPGTTVIDVSLRHLRARGWANAEFGVVDTDVYLAAEPRHGLDQLLAAVTERLKHAARDEADRRERRRADVSRRHEEVRRQQREKVEAAWNRTPISPSRMVTEVWQAVREHDWLLTLRNTRSWPEGAWDFTHAGQWLGHSGGGGVGYGPGAMLGGALAGRDRGQLPVAIIGDGDLHMGVGALWTAVHYGIPLLVVVNNNRSFYNDEQHQTTVANNRGRPSANSWIGMRLDQPSVDLAALARSYGVWGAGPVEDPAELGPVLSEAVDRVAEGGVALVDVRTSPA